VKPCPWNRLNRVTKKGGNLNKIIKKIIHWNFIAVFLKI
jgi:hypothetical protein